MSAELETAIARCIDAVNAGDTEAFLDSFKTDGVVDDWGREFVGRDQIRGWSDRELIGKNEKLEVTGTRSEGGRHVLTTQVSGDGFNGPSTFIFEVGGDRIARMTIRE